MKSAFACLPLALLLTACTTIKKYEPKAEPGPARAEDYPVYLYQLYAEVPRAHEVIGTLSIHDTPFTVYGGSLEKELDALRRKARKVGADALHLQSVDPPGFLHAKYRMAADLIRFTEEWEAVPFTEADFRAYLDQHSGSLDPLEGIWTGSDRMRTRLGIVRSEPGKDREFVAFILENMNPTWELGDVKMELRRGNRPGVYRGLYYLDDYRSQRIAFRLGVPGNNVFLLPLSEDGPPIVFARE
jgi:hypothetical protein